MNEAVSNNTSRPICIPDGCYIPELPKINYRNKNDQCIVMCCASAIHFLGYKEEASVFITICNETPTKQQAKKAFNNYQPMIVKALKAKKGGKVRVSRPYYSPADLSSRSPNPIVVSLKVTLGKQLSRINHCVCFVGDYIFDANREFALPNNVSSLNLICDGVKSGTT